MKQTEKVGEMAERTGTTSRRISARDRREQILRVAMNLFAGKGFKGTTTREIAEAAGVNEALIFRHFPTKGDLYEAILEWKTGQCRQEFGLMQEEAAERRDDLSFFQSLARGILRFHREDGTFLRLLLYSGLEGQQLSRSFFQTQAVKHFNFLAGYIEKRIQDGAFLPRDPKVAARAFLGMVTHQALVAELFDPAGKLLATSDVDTIADEFVELFLEGIKKQ